jgi:hypothetical protein
MTTVFFFFFFFSVPGQQRHVRKSPHAFMPENHIKREQMFGGGALVGDIVLHVSCSAATIRSEDAQTWLGGRRRPAGGSVYACLLDKLLC